MYRPFSGCSTALFPRCGSLAPSARMRGSARAVGLVISLLLAVVCVPPVLGAPAADRSSLEAASKVMDGGKGVEADVFAPRA